MSNSHASERFSDLIIFQHFVHEGRRRFGVLLKEVLEVCHGLVLLGLLFKLALFKKGLNIRLLIHRIVITQLNKTLGKTFIKQQIT